MCVVSFFLFRKSPPDWIKLFSLSAFCERKRSLFFLFLFLKFFRLFVKKTPLSLKKNTDNNNNNNTLIIHIILIIKMRSMSMGTSTSTTSAHGVRPFAVTPTTKSTRR